MHYRERQTTRYVTFHGKRHPAGGSHRQTWDALEARELIKITVQRNAPYENAREACDVLCERVHAEPVQVIGNRFVIYRRARKDSQIDVDQLV